MASLLDTGNLPNYQRKEFTAVLNDIALIEDLLAGTRKMWEKARKYIHKWTEEPDDVYKLRSTIANVFGGLTRTLSACVGMLFARTPQIEWNQAQARIEPHWANIDAMGTAGHVFAKRFSEKALAHGLAVILIDHTPPPPGVLIHAGNEDDFNLRPTWAMYERCQVWNWRLAVVGNKKVLTQITFYEQSEVAVGRFGSQLVNQWRVLSLENGVAVWRLWRQKVSSNQIMSELDIEPAGAGVFKNKAGDLAVALPVAIAYTGRTDAPLCASIPLLDVAWANLAHWQQSSDLRYYRHLSAFPQPVIEGQLVDEPDGKGGVTPGRIRFGPGVGIHIQAGGSFEWAEVSGTSMNQLEQGITSSEKHMAQLGMSFMFKETRSAETAEAKRLDATAENSTLGTAAQGIEDAINTAFEWHGWYMGIEKAGCPVISISKDFENTAMDPPTMLAYVTAVVQAGLPVRILLEAWQAGGRLPPDTDLDALEAEMLVAAAQLQAQKDEIAAQNTKAKAA